MSDSSPVGCELLISYSGSSILGLHVICKLVVNVSLFTVQHDVSDVHTSILKRTKLTGGMNIIPDKLEVSGDPVFLKKRIVSFGQHKTICQAITAIFERGLVKPVESSTRAMPFVTLLKADDKTQRNCSDYRFTVNKKLPQRTYITEELGNILDGFVDSMDY